VNCKLHSDRDAVACCISCGNMVCTECDVVVAQKHHCKQCLADAVPASAAPAEMVRGPVPVAQRAYPPRRLYRSATDRVLGGVCGGIARYSGVDPAMVRLVVAVSMLAGLSVVAYILAWIIIPLEQPDADGDLAEG
jgi:phage shock protein PspC (stress-responsive transcriptional regulator)